jgi:hypothetical protein
MILLPVTVVNVEMLPVILILGGIALIKHTNVPPFR